MAKSTPGEETVEIPDIRRRRPELPIRCGDCLFLTRYSTYPTPCEKFGTVPSSEPCTRFVPDPAKLGEPKDLRNTLRLLARARNPHLVAAMMLMAKRVRRHGHELGDVVYFRVLGDDYLNNYAYGVVSGCTSQALVITGAQSFVATIGSEQILGRDAWVAKRSALVSRDRIEDPSGGLRKIAVRGRERLMAYEPSQLDGRRSKKRQRSTFGGKKPRVNNKGPITLSSGDSR